MTDRVKKLKETLEERILVLDGATGTALGEVANSPEVFGGEKYEGLYEALNIHSPEFVLHLHKTYIDAGADIIETNTFSGSSIVLEEYGLESQTREINRRGAELARDAIEKYGNGKELWVAGSMGPSTKTIQVTGGIDFDGVVAQYYPQIMGLIEGGVDYLLVETSQDSLNIKAILEAVERANDELGADTPVAVSITIETTGTMLAGQNIEAAVYTLSAFDLLYLGLNCATGPEFMTDHLRTLAGLYPGFVAVVPNAGLPNVDGEYDETAQQLSEVLQRFAKNGWVNLVGGCCGTTDEYIRMINEKVARFDPRIPPKFIDKSATAGSEALILEEDNRPVLVGERTNVIGSRKFKRLVTENRFEEAAEVGRSQARGGAGILDLCAANPDRIEIDDFLSILKPLLRKTRTPIMIDSTDSEVIEAALKNIGGRAVINSVNFEDGEEKIREVAALAKKHGAVLIVGLIDEDPDQGMAITVERKLEVTERAFNLLTQEFGFDDGEIIFDPLVFPCGTGDKNYIGSAQQTILGVKAIKEKYPRSKTILGVSNVSFGLPKEGREVLNGVFLYHCIQAGLDFAIVNTTGLKRYASIPEEERELCLDLLNDRRKDAIERFAAFFREARPSDAAKVKDMPVKERIEYAVIEGVREDLIKNLDKALKKDKPLDIINGPLMDGMAIVGERFGANQLIIAEVLESAEVMKAAVSYLESKLPEGEKSQSRGKIILATVKGDVHDIGKNLVDMILSNNGYEVVNLGIKVPPAKLLEAVREHKPDIVGLSGLLVKSAQMMVSTAEDLHSAGVDIPIIVGGAALTRDFTLTRISPAYGDIVFYAEDAMKGLTLCHNLQDSVERKTLYESWREIQKERLEKQKKKTKVKPVSVPKEKIGWREVEIPSAPDHEIHLYEPEDLDALFSYINKKMLYGKHLGLPRPEERLTDKDDKQAQKVLKAVDRVKEEVKRSDWFKPKALYSWVESWSKGDSLFWNNNGSSVELNLPRQQRDSFLCAADWVAPEGKGDSIVLFITTCGKDPNEIALKWKEEGRLLDSFILQVLAIETAESLAEIVHQKIRKEWGIPDKEEITLKEIFKSKYHGVRLSFGYPACPDLEDQTKLFDLLKPEKKIDVRLTSGFMMEPEASVSALVFHHPDGHYFRAE